MTQAEHDAIARVLSECGGAVASEPAATQTPEPSVPATTGVYFANCAAARAAGATPLYAGQPGYRPEMDGDRDGVACE